MARCDEHWDRFDFSSCLTEELRHQTDPNRRTSLLFALIRKLENIPEESETVRALLSEVSRLLPNDSDLVWERWRFHCLFDAKERLQALLDVKGVLEFPDDIVHAHMIASEILSEHLLDHARALKEIDTVRKIAPERSEALLASAKTRALGNRPVAEWAGDLEIFVDTLTDPTIRAALFFELAELFRTSGADAAQVTDYLSRALSQNGADWSVLDGILRSAEKIEDTRLMETSVEKIAEAALKPEDESDDDKPDGHGFSGFERGEESAGAYFWLLSGIRERLLKNKETALSAMERAQALLPRNRLLKLERARLLDAVGRSEDAFAAVPEDVPFLELAIFALSAGKHEEAAYLASLEREHTVYADTNNENEVGEAVSRLNRTDGDISSLFSEIAFESLTGFSSPPSVAAPPCVLEYWFDSRPDHEEAEKIAEALKSEVSSTSLVRLFLEENTPADSPIVDVTDGRKIEPWSHALSALLKDEPKRSDAFESWANTVSDPVLKSTLLHVAASLHLKETSADAKHATRLLEQACACAREFSEEKEVSQTAANDDTDDRNSTAVEDPLTSLVERALRLSEDLNDPRSAVEVLKEAAARPGCEPPDDIAVRLLLLDLACKMRDFHLVTDTLSDLISKSGDDGRKMLLCLGELNLLQGRNLKASLSNFDEAERLIGDESGRARIDRLLTLHLLNEEDAIQRALKESPGRKRSIEADFFEWDDEDDTGLAAQALLEGKDELPIHTNVVKMLSALANGEKTHGESESEQDEIERMLENIGPDPAPLSAVAVGLRRLASGLLDERLGAACLAAATLLDGKCDAAKPSDIHLDAADERLVHLADRPIFDLRMNEQFAKEARRIKSSDLFEWVDWMLSAAEAAAESEGPRRALDLVHEALAAAPDHPGLLEAEVLFANMCGEYEEAADTRGRLARFYVSKDEKVHQLVQAALILFDKLQDARGARNILNEAKRRNPGHAEANEVWQYVLHAACDSDETKESEETQAERETIRDSAKAYAESEERKIERLIGLNRLEAAMEAVNRLLIRHPDRLSAHRTRLDLLTRTKQWAKAVAAAEVYFNAASHKEERRSIAFRAAAIADDVLKDPTLAIAWMLRLREVGDTFLEAENRIREIADKAGIVLEDEGVPSEYTENSGRETKREDP